eukprot:1560171-Rhodomonas_salina.1
MAGKHLSRGFKIEELADRAESGTLFSADALSHAISGSVGGNVAMLAFYPLDQLVTRAQAASKGTSKHPWKALVDVVATEGVSGLYRGLNSTLITLFAANFIYFYAFHFVRIVSTRKGTLKDVIEKMGLSRPGRLRSAFSRCVVAFATPCCGVPCINLLFDAMPASLGCERTAQASGQLSAYARYAMTGTDLGCGTAREPRMIRSSTKGSWYGVLCVYATATGCKSLTSHVVLPGCDSPHLPRRR